MTGYGFYPDILLLKAVIHNFSSLCVVPESASAIPFMSQMCQSLKNINQWHSSSVRIGDVNLGCWTLCRAISQSSFPANNSVWRHMKKCGGALLCPSVCAWISVLGSHGTGHKIIRISIGWDERVKNLIRKILIALPAAILQQQNPCVCVRCISMHICARGTADQSYYSKLLTRFSFGELINTAFSFVDWMCHDICHSDMFKITESSLSSHISRVYERCEPACVGTSTASFSSKQWL